ncbi:hypothetical protein HOLleu_06285 [Holothuria leucospilota]|uniref:Uncharacterized protein n=1 Tax=Holothuria leucospilota TaxID=206669 RepID=A0A9Q1CKP3_HOLLE|nr:hypothetical protein HOLleu_06285 [Holothuria leucospilota]
MPLLRTQCLILLSIAAALSFGDFRLGPNGSDELNPNKQNKLENSIHYLKAVPVRTRHISLGSAFSAHLVLLDQGGHQVSKGFPAETEEMGEMR